jgi:hypothetical protein
MKYNILVSYECPLSQDFRQLEKNSNRFFSDEVQKTLEIAPFSRSKLLSGCHNQQLQSFSCSGINMMDEF